MKTFHEFLKEGDVIPFPKKKQEPKKSAPPPEKKNLVKLAEIKNDLDLIDNESKHQFTYVNLIKNMGTKRHSLEVLYHHIFHDWGDVRDENDYPDVAFAKKVAKDRDMEIAKHISNRLGRYNELATRKKPISALASQEINRRADKLKQMQTHFAEFFLTQ